MTGPNTEAKLPERYGPYGGRYVPETLIPALDELEQAWIDAWGDPAFRAELDIAPRRLLRSPTPLYLAQRISEEVGHEVWLKREDLMHTGSHKLNNALGQALLAKRMGKTRMIAETAPARMASPAPPPARSSGCSASSTWAPKTCVGRHNVERMRMLGTEVRPVEDGTRTLKEAVSPRSATGSPTSATRTTSSARPSALRHTRRSSATSSAASATSRASRSSSGRAACPTAPSPASVGGSNAIGMFAGFMDDPDVALVGVEAAGDGVDTPRHGAPLTVGGRPGILHGSLSAIMQDDEGQILEAHSISAGLDYPGTGPEHAWLRDTGRAQYVAVTDAQAVAAFKRVARLEGIVPALETAHAFAYVFDGPKDTSTLDVVCLSGRGDKDLAEVLARD